MHTGIVAKYSQFKVKWQPAKEREREWKKGRG